MSNFSSLLGTLREDVVHRTRRTRETETLRRMVRETRLSVDRLIYPMFVVEGEGVKQEISSMPGQYQLSVDKLVEDCREVADLGIPGVILFGIPDHKDDHASEAYAENGVVQRAVRALKRVYPDLCVMTDVCLCEYMAHGHCGIVEDGRILNDPTLELLERTAVSHAQAGADVIAPSDMMDGRVGGIRKALDGAGFSHLPIMAYSAKYASCFYGPFRVAAESAPSFGDRNSYQMDPANSREAMREIDFDLDEGADIIMVKPALPYLDIIARARERVDCPIAAYNVSGEFAMITAASRNGWIDGERAFLETLTSICRAGADMVLTYFAKDAARRLAGDTKTPLSWM
ncbi:MAG: porphobilinogen synthase [bacterium]|nr:porphobilinogen synthase [bacterium]